MQDPGHRQHPLLSLVPAIGQTEDELRQIDADAMAATATDLRQRALKLPLQSRFRAHLLAMATGYAVASLQGSDAALLRVIQG